MCNQNFSESENDRQRWEFTRQSPQYYGRHKHYRLKKILSEQFAKCERKQQGGFGECALVLVFCTVVPFLCPPVLPIRLKFLVRLNYTLFRANFFSKFRLIQGVILIKYALLLKRRCYIYKNNFGIILRCNTWRTIA